MVSRKGSSETPQGSFLIEEAFDTIGKQRKSFWRNNPNFSNQAFTAYESQLR